MKTKKQKNIARPVRKMIHPLSCRKPNTIEVQTWGLDANNELLCAGVYFVPRIDTRTIYRIGDNWRRWRKWYDSLPENRLEDYPAKHNKPLANYGAHPIGFPEQTKWVKFV